MPKSSGAKRPCRQAVHRSTFDWTGAESVHLDALCGITSGLGSGGLTRERDVRLRMGYGACRFDASRGYQIAAAKNATHGHGIDKVGVGTAVAVHANFCCHRARQGYSAKVAQWAAQADADFRNRLIRFSSRLFLSFELLSWNPTRRLLSGFTHFFFADKMRSTCSRWFRSCPAIRRTMCSMVSCPRSECIP